MIGSAMGLSFKAGRRRHSQSYVEAFQRRRWVHAAPTLRATGDQRLRVGARGPMLRWSSLEVATATTAGLRLAWSRKTPSSWPPPPFVSLLEG